MPKLYYTAPSDEIFNEVKEKAERVWKSLDSHPSYLAEKLGRIDIKNVEDNMMYIVGMFDIDNQFNLRLLLSSEAVKAIADRLKDGDQPDEYNVFL